MCPFYNAYLFEITGTTKGVFTHSQSSCHIAKVVLAFSHDSRQIPIASDAPPRHTSRGFLHWRFAYAGPGARRSTFMGPASENLHRSRHSPMDRRFITAAEIPISNVMEPQCLLGHLTRTVLTPMYGPAVRCKKISSNWRRRSCINVSGLRLERVVLRAIMDISARAF